MILRKRRNEHSNPLFVQLNLLKLEDVCNLNICLFVFKSINDFIYCPIKFEARDIGPHDLRTREPLVVPFSRSSQTKRSVRIRGAQMWNALPDVLRTSRSVATFKAKMKRRFKEIYSQNV